MNRGQDHSKVTAGGIDAMDDGIAWGDAKVGYDNDGDIDDAGDERIWSETFGSTSRTVSHNHAGNLIDDVVFRYVYDAWNRPVNVESPEDSRVATFQEAEFDGMGRRMKKVVSNSGVLDSALPASRADRKAIVGFAHRDVSRRMPRWYTSIMVRRSSRPGTARGICISSSSTGRSP